MLLLLLLIYLLPTRPASQLFLFFFFFFHVVYLYVELYRCTRTYCLLVDVYVCTYVPIVTSCREVNGAAKTIFLQLTNIPCMVYRRTSLVRKQVGRQHKLSRVQWSCNLGCCYVRTYASTSRAAVAKCYAAMDQQLVADGNIGVQLNRNSLLHWLSCCCCCCWGLHRDR